MNVIPAWIETNKLLILLVIGTVGSCSWLILVRKKLNMAWYMAALLAIGHTAVGVISVKVFAFMESGFDADSIGNMNEPVRRNLFHAGILLSRSKTYYAEGSRCLRYFYYLHDFYGHVCPHQLYFLRVLWGGKMIPFAAFEGLHWPTREMEVIFYIILLIILGKKVIKEDAKGRIYPIYMISYGIFRFISNHHGLQTVRSDISIWRISGP